MLSACSNEWIKKNLLYLLPASSGYWLFVISKAETGYGYVSTNPLPSTSSQFPVPNNQFPITSSQ